MLNFGGVSALQYRAGNFYGSDLPFSELKDLQYVNGVFRTGFLKFGLGGVGKGGLERGWGGVGEGLEKGSGRPLERRWGRFVESLAFYLSKFENPINVPQKRKQAET